jgi:hypothetical protein
LADEPARRWIERFEPLCHDAFRFLLDEHGFERAGASGDYRGLSVAYRNEEMFVDILYEPYERILEVGFGALVDGEIPKATIFPSPRKPEQRFYLQFLLQLRGDPDPARVSRVGTEVGLTLQEAAEALRTYGSDVLAGDLSVTSELDRMMKERLRAGMTEQARDPSTFVLWVLSNYEKSVAILMVGNLMHLGILYSDLQGIEKIAVARDAVTIGRSSDEEWRQGWVRWATYHAADRGKDVGFDAYRIRIADGETFSAIALRLPPGLDAEKAEDLVQDIVERLRGALEYEQYVGLFVEEPPVSHA